jgi:anti-sigma regulatory factor (Ser/Thr protein kinase)
MIYRRASVVYLVAGREAGQTRVGCKAHVAPGAEAAVLGHARDQTQSTGMQVRECTVADGRGESIRFARGVWPAHPRELAPMRAAVYRWLAPLSLPADAEHDLVFAVGEAATNSVEHAYRPSGVGDTVELTFWTEHHTVYFEVADHGIWKVPAGEPTGRGRGIEMMQRLMTFVLIRHDDRGTRVLMSQTISEN